MCAARRQGADVEGQLRGQGGVRVRPELQDPPEGLPPGCGPETGFTDVEISSNTIPNVYLGSPPPSSPGSPPPFLICAKKPKEEDKYFYIKSEIAQKYPPNGKMKISYSPFDVQEISYKIENYDLLQVKVDIISAEGLDRDFDEDTSIEGVDSITVDPWSGEQPAEPPSEGSGFFLVYDAIISNWPPGPRILEINGVSYNYTQVPDEANGEVKVYVQPQLSHNLNTATTIIIPPSEKTYPWRDGGEGEQGNFSFTIPNISIIRTMIIVVI